LNGIDAVRKIKEVDPNVKVVLMSGYTSEIPEDVMVEAYLPKPFKAMHLHQVVKDVLGDDTPAPWVA
jgi:two-component SAPR family response regulator